MMAVNPHEAQKLSKTEQKQANAVEASIDDMLQEGDSTFAVSLFPSDKVCKYIVNKCEASGQNVMYHSDQRDGDYLEFKPASRQD